MPGQRPGSRDSRVLSPGLGPDEAYAGRHGERLRRDGSPEGQAAGGGDGGVTAVDREAEGRPLHGDERSVLWMAVRAGSAGCVCHGNMLLADGARAAGLGTANGPGAAEGDRIDFLLAKLRLLTASSLFQPPLHQSLEKD
ncbi:unnamed protein product [Lota lota]